MQRPLDLMEIISPFPFPQCISKSLLLKYLSSRYSSFKRRTFFIAEARDGCVRTVCSPEKNLLFFKIGIILY